MLALNRFAVRPAARDLRRSARGLTLIEILVVMSIAAILAAIAVPNFSGFMDRRRADSGADALLRGLALARAEALARGTRVVFCGGVSGGCGTDFGAGYRVFTDVDGSGSFSAGDTMVQQVGAVSANTSVTNNLGGASITFQPSGFPSAGGASQSGNLLVVSGTYQRRICLSRAGVVGSVPAGAVSGTPAACP